jgi:hypothetical protein
MIEFQRKIGPFIIKNIWFSDDLYDVEGVDAVQFIYSNYVGDKPGFSKEITTTLVIDLTKSLEEMWNSMDKKSTRLKILRALEDSSYVVRFNEKYEEFIDINRDFRKRKGLPPSMMSAEEMKAEYLLWTYEKDGVVLGGDLCIRDKNRIVLLNACSSMTSDSVFSRTTYSRANRLSIWEIIKYAKKEGMKEFDFGGFEQGKRAEELKGLNEFKASFGGVMRERYTYSKSYSKLFYTGRFIYLTAVITRYKLKSITNRMRANRTARLKTN